MHEVAIAEDIKDIVIQKLKENNGKKVKKIELIIGEMTTIVPEALKFAFGVVSKDTPIENAKIKINIQKAKAVCKLCNKRFIVKGFNFICPQCQSLDVEIINGKEMILKTIEMEK